MTRVTNPRQQTYLEYTMTSGVVNRKERNGITRKERRERSLYVTLRKNFAHFAVKKISLFLIIVVGLENQ